MLPACLMSTSVNSSRHKAIRPSKRQSTTCTQQALLLCLRACKHVLLVGHNQLLTLVLMLVLVLWLVMMMMMMMMMI